MLSATPCRALWPNHCVRKLLHKSPVPFIAYRLQSTVTQNKRKRFQLWTDASKYGYGAVLDPEPNQESAHDVFFVHRTHSRKHGCQGVFLPSTHHIEQHEAYAILLAVDRWKHLMRHGEIICHTDSTGARAILKRCPGDGESDLKSDNRSNEEKDLCGAFQALEKEYNIDMEVEWIGRTENRLADRLSRAAEEKYRRLVTEEMRRQLGDTQG